MLSFDCSAKSPGGLGYQSHSLAYQAKDNQQLSAMCTTHMQPVAALILATVALASADNVLSYQGAASSLQAPRPPAFLTSNTLF